MWWQLRSGQVASTEDGASRSRLLFAERAQGRRDDEERTGDDNGLLRIGYCLGQRDRLGHIFKNLDLRTEAFGLRQMARIGGALALRTGEDDPLCQRRQLSQHRDPVFILREAEYQRQENGKPLLLQKRPQRDRARRVVRAIQDHKGPAEKKLETAGPLGPA